MMFITFSPYPIQQQVMNLIGTPIEVLEAEVSQKQYPCQTFLGIMRKGRSREDSIGTWIQRKLEMPVDVTNHSSHSTDTMYVGSPLCTNSSLCG